MILAQAELITSIKELGPMGMSLLLLAWIVIKGGPAQEGRWLAYVRGRDADHKSEREEERKVRHEHAQFLQSLAGLMERVDDKTDLILNQTKGS